jgi:hypothetical protein
VAVAVPPLIYALFVDPPWGLVWVALLFLFIYQVEGHIVVPNVMANALALHPLLVIFGLLAGGELYGIAGVLVALPTMAGGVRSGSSSASACSWRAGTKAARGAGRGRAREPPKAASGSR